MADITWENANLDEFPTIEIDGVEFPYAVQDSKVEIMDAGDNNVTTKKLSNNTVAISEEVNQNGAKVGIPVYQTPGVRKWIRDRKAEGLFTIKFLYTKAGYVEQIVKATIEKIVTGQGGDTVQMVVNGSKLDIQRTA